MLGHLAKEKRITTVRVFSERGEGTGITVLQKPTAATASLAVDGGNSMCTTSLLAASGTTARSVGRSTRGIGWAMLNAASHSSMSSLGVHG